MPVQQRCPLLSQLQTDIKKEEKAVVDTAVSMRKKPYFIIGESKIVCRVLMNWRFLAKKT